MAELSQQDKEKIESYIKLFPKRIEVSVMPCEEGGYTARVLSLKGAITQGENFADLISMLNWLVLDWLEVPKKFASFMPTYLPPVALAKKLNVFPRVQKVDALVGEFSIPV